MREHELRAAAKCALCGKPFGSSGLPLFWRVRVERHAVLHRALQRQAGLEMMLGSVALAQVMGADEEMTEPFAEPLEFTVCEPCAVVRTCLAEMAEAGKREAGQ